MRSLFLIYFLVFIAFGVPIATTLPFTLEALNATEFQYSLTEVAESVGFAIRSLVLIRYMGRLREGEWLTIDFLGITLASMLYAASGTVAWVIVFELLLGCANPPSVVARRLIRQRESPRQMRGRVASAFLLWSWVCCWRVWMDVRLLQRSARLSCLG